MSENLTRLSARRGLDQNLFEAIVRSKGEPLNVKNLSTKYKIGEANIVAASTSYDFIQGEKAGKKAYYCTGSSCVCAGTQETIKNALLKHFNLSQISQVTCLGRCHENASFQVNGQNYSGNDYLNLDSILKHSADHTQPQSDECYRVYSLLEKPILTQAYTHLFEYYSLFNQTIDQQTQNQIIEQIIASGLKGRGGAGFPTGVKWQSCAAQPSDEKYIVCNADEGDPGAFSDRYLLEQRPHSVLFGMLLAGYLSAARWGVIYIRGEYPEAVDKMQTAIKEFESLNEASKIFPFQFKIIRGAGAYICGEETALLRSIEGQKPMVSVRPPFPTVQGLFGKPTIVNNVETFACIHWILENSAKAFSTINRTTETSGSKLLSLDSAFKKPGIYEVAMGEKLSRVIEQAGGFKRPLKALHIGGPLGGLVPLSHINQLAIDFKSFADAGFLLGHASVIGIPEPFSMPRYVQHLFEFTAEESCGKCFPCRLGAIRGSEMFREALGHLQHSTVPQKPGVTPTPNQGLKQVLNQELLHDLLETMEKGSLCALGGGVPLPIRNALEYFPEEFKTLFSTTKTHLSNDQNRGNGQSDDEQQ